MSEPNEETLQSGETAMDTPASETSEVADDIAATQPDKDCQRCEPIVDEQQDISVSGYMAEESKESNGNHAAAIENECSERREVVEEDDTQRNVVTTCAQQYDGAADIDGENVVVAIPSSGDEELRGTDTSDVCGDSGSTTQEVLSTNQCEIKASVDEIQDAVNADENKEQVRQQLNAEELHQHNGEGDSVLANDHCKASDTVEASDTVAGVDAGARSEVEHMSNDQVVSDDVSASRHENCGSIEVSDNKGVYVDAGNTNDIDKVKNEGMNTEQMQIIESSQSCVEKNLLSDRTVENNETAQQQPKDQQHSADVSDVSAVAAALLETNDSSIPTQSPDHVTADETADSSATDPVASHPPSAESAMLSSPVRVASAVLGVAVSTAVSLSAASSFESLQFSDTSSPSLQRKDISTINSYGNESVLNNAISQHEQCVANVQCSDGSVVIEQFHTNEPHMSEADDLLSELNEELGASSSSSLPNNLQKPVATDMQVSLPNGAKQLQLSDIPQYKQLHDNYLQLQKQYNQQQHTLQQLQAKEQNASKTNEEADKLKQLEDIIAGHHKEVENWRNKLMSHDATAKKAVAALQHELRVKVEQINKKYEECLKEKESVVVKYAQAEGKSIVVTNKARAAEDRMKEAIRDKQQAVHKMKQFHADKERAHAAMEKKHQELIAARREIDKQASMLSSADVKVKWAQNKLKVETDLHMETKLKLDEANRKIKEVKEEADQLRQDCQKMIHDYQNSEEFKSNSLDIKLKDREAELLAQKQQSSDTEEMHQVVLRELEGLKQKHKDLLAEHKTYVDKVRCLDGERMLYEETNKKLRTTVQTQKTDNEALRAKLTSLQDIQERYQRESERVQELESENAELKQSMSDIQQENDRCSEREAEHLVFTQKMSDKNARLQAENTELHAKVQSLSSDIHHLTESCEELENRNSKLEDARINEKQQRTDDVDELKSSIQEKSDEVVRLKRELADAQDEIRTLKRRHTANTKDLTRQLQQAKKRLDQLEAKGGNGGTSGGNTPSMGSRTSSTHSLDTGGSTTMPPPGPTGAAGYREDPTPVEENPPVVEVVHVDKQMLIEKIVRLQKAHARKNEKLEFMDDHIKQLLQDIQKKNKIIQDYVLREETGTLAPEAFDRNKAAMSRHGGIMASVYSSHSQDAAMTLDLSLDINRKLQTVLEDTLLKNITLKENLETLGSEISHLSQENRKLQLAASAADPSAMDPKLSAKAVAVASKPLH